jgi:hypothetical protein
LEPATWELFDPGRRSSVDFLRPAGALRKVSITGSTIVGGHGTTATQADIAAALAAN